MYTALVVDDEAIERDGIEFLIGKQAYPINVQKANNGQEAYDLLQKQQVDIMLTDIKMPFMNGLQLSELTKSLYPDIIIIILTAYGDFEYTKHAIKIKVDDYVLKPIILDEFHNIMSKALNTLDARKDKIQKRKDLMEHYNNASFYQKERLLNDILNQENRDLLNKNDSDSNEALDKKVISDLINLIEENYSMDIGLEWLSKKVYLSTGYISSIFKKKTGKSIMQYITLCRLENAKKLLTTSNMKITDICQQVGYNNESYFCLLFRKYYGITANQMREIN